MDENSISILESDLGFPAAILQVLALPLIVLRNGQAAQGIPPCNRRQRSIPSHTARGRLCKVIPGFKALLCIWPFKGRNGT